MSYALAFTDRAISKLNALESWLQEEALDEIDQLASTPPTTGRRSVKALVHDFIRERNNLRYYVFITYRLNSARQILQVRVIGSHIRAVS